jgi:hypothetical protein
MGISTQVGRNGFVKATQSTVCRLPSVGKGMHGRDKREVRRVHQAHFMFLLGAQLSYISQFPQQAVWPGY